MATFTTTEKALTFELFGIPRTGTTATVTGIMLRPPTMAPAEATYKEGTHANIVSLLEAQIALVEALPDNGTVNRIKHHIAEYADISNSVLRIDSSREGSGRIANDEKKVEKLRRLVSDNLGFAVPRGGYSWDAEVAYGDWNGGGWERY